MSLNINTSDNSTYVELVHPLLNFVITIDIVKFQTLFSPIEQIKLCTAPDNV